VLVVVSDLHFCDGTATPRNVAAAAFDLLGREVEALARENRARDIDLVFDGDVFDLLRTTRWFSDAEGREVPLAERPWGSPEALDTGAPPAAVLQRAHGILDEILEVNREALGFLRSLGARAALPVRRIGLFGNHDRLALHDPRLRARMLEALGAVDGGAARDGERIGLHAALLPRYRAVVRHGHEWDAWNFERWRAEARPSSYRDEDYLCAPIGDPITTELVARFPFELHRRLEGTREFRGTPQLEHVRLRMQRVEDVRPLVASFRWIACEAGRLHGSLPAGQQRVLADALRDVVGTIAREFEALPFYREWHRRHDRLLRFDQANELQLVLSALRSFDINDVSRFVAIYEHALARLGDRGADPLAGGAPREDLDVIRGEGLRFVVYGHTHEPLEMPLRADEKQDVYLNSGTFRERQYAAPDGGFIGWEQVTWLAFYDRDETPASVVRSGPGFERWTGTRKVLDHGTAADPRAVTPAPEERIATAAAGGAEAATERPGAAPAATGRAGRRPRRR
jgi:UDP-2,3-diacylglucosamine pyrophosphatase LpxH